MSGASPAVFECFARLGAPLARFTVSVSSSTSESGRRIATMHALALYMNHVVKREHIEPYEENAVGKVGLGDDGNGWKAVANEHIEKTELQDVLRTLAVLIRSVDGMPDLALSKGEAIQRDSVSVLYGHEQMRLYLFSSSLSLLFLCCFISFHF